MISVDKITASALYSQDFIFLNIKFKETSEDFANYKINLLRASGESEFVLIKTDLKSFEYYDYNVNLCKRGLHYFYKIEIEELSTGHKEMSRVYTTLQAEPQYFGAAILRLYNKYLSEIVRNPEIYILVKKETGQICPTCYDIYRKRAQDPNCPVCSGTGYVDGYYKPIEAKINILNPQAQTEEFTPSSVSRTIAPLTAWTMNYPILKVGDIIVLHDNSRYIVISLQFSKERNFLIRQMFQMQLIPPTDSVYTISVEVNR